MSIEETADQNVPAQQALRNDLKTWEKAFAAANGGRRPGREDIKKVPEIAAKYKTYDKLRTRALSKNPFEIQGSCSSSPPPPAKKSKSLDTRDSHTTPRKSNVVTPGKAALASLHHPSTLDPYDAPLNHPTPSSERTRRIIGPTPQKNGKVMGLFDLLSPPSSKEKKPVDTPLKKQHTTATVTETTTALLPSASLYSTTVESTAPLTTPSKSRSAACMDLAIASSLTTTPIARRHSRTPQSSGKRKFLDAFLTPSTRRVNALVDATPSSRPKQQTQAQPSPRSDRTWSNKVNDANHARLTDFLDQSPVPTLQPQHLAPPKSVSAESTETTPAFLRRFTAPVMCRSGNLNSRSHSASGADAPLGADINISVPIPMRLPRRKPMVRSLSEMVRSLREAEEERLDEEMEIMAEMEREGEGAEARPKKPRVEVGDSQVGGSDAAGAEMEMRLGADGEWPSEDNEGAEDGLKEGGGGGARKVWKKKGQKRTTRRVKMKPRTEKWRPEKEWGGDGGGEDGGVEDQDGTGDEKTAGATQAPEGGTEESSGDSGDETYREVENAEGKEQAPKKEAKKKRGRPPKKAAGEKTEGGKGKGKPRKVNQAAHANFRALKIKNKNSRAKKGGRFGRRR